MNEKYWEPIHTIRNSLVQKYNSKNNRILEVGPGDQPFPIATHFIDCDEDKPHIRVDVDKEPIPFPNNYFEFVYCRHVLEDIQNPDFLFRELVRVSKYGFIETPSPLFECSSGIDNTTLDYKGYIHHRYVVWTENDTNTLCLLPKYPIIEYIELDKLYSTYIKTDVFWNNYYEWSPENPPNIRMYKNGVNFNILTDYTRLLSVAVIESIKSSEKYLPLSENCSEQLLSY